MFMFSKRFTEYSPHLWFRHIFVEFRLWTLSDIPTEVVEMRRIPLSAACQTPLPATGFPYKRVC